MELPKLMRDDSEKDGHAEAVMDYVFSWCFRYSLDIYVEQKPILSSQCKKILCRILELPSDIEIIEVKVWKQECNIDLWIEVIINHHGIIERHAGLIENKYYSKLQNAKDVDGEYRSQLIVYKTKFDDFYRNQNDEWIKHYILITCIERDEDKFLQYLPALEMGYSIFTFYEMLGDCTMETESDIYNEFWLRW